HRRRRAHGAAREPSRQQPRAGLAPPRNGRRPGMTRGIDTHAAARRSPLAGRRMLFVAPDDYPAYRVDLTELFSRHLVGRGLSIDWSLHRVDVGLAAIDDRGAERFVLPSHRKGGIVAKIRNRISNGA